MKLHWELTHMAFKYLEKCKVPVGAYEKVCALHDLSGTAMMQKLCGKAFLCQDYDIPACTLYPDGNTLLLLTEKIFVESLKE